jgi:hypothetical protein
MTFPLNYVVLSLNDDLRASPWWDFSQHGSFASPIDPKFLLFLEITNVKREGTFLCVNVLLIK